MTRASAVIRAGLSGQSQHTALHTPHRLIRVFSSRSCASKVTKSSRIGSLAVTPTHRPLTTARPVKTRPFGPPVYRADRVARCVSRGCPSPRNPPPPLIHMCDSTQNEKKQHAHAALKGFSVRHRESKLPLSFTFRGFCKKIIKKKRQKKKIFLFASSGFLV